MNYFKDFDKWNSLKKKIDLREVDESIFFHERDVWWCSIGVNIGVESNGKNDFFERPVLILKVFNKDMIWCLSITSTIKASPFYYLINFETGPRSVMITQIRTVSSKRFLRKVDSVSDEDFVAIKYAVSAILLESETPAINGGISEAEATNTLSISEVGTESQGEAGESELD
ncbi:MAG: type II toxin-antitoxin system PemK/MazF family toxin [bacterium]|nr:type II toxin-antitoxin system PemK/MazF family toxin [bacterium]